MKKTTFIIYTLYLWCRVLYGLVIHPYKTAIDNVRHPILVPVVLTPLFTLFLLLLLGKTGTYLIHVYGISRYLISVFLSISLISLICWQVLVLYFLLILVSSKR